MGSNISVVKNEACFGCSACASICPQKAICLIVDKYGFLSPVIDKSKCINCGLCTSVCPAINRWEAMANAEIMSYEIYGALSTNANRRISSSGGIFPEIAKVAVKGHTGHVVGCIVDDNLHIKHVMTDDIDAIRKMSDSKYVQSDMGDCFINTYNALCSEKFVLFSGTSCQIHGLLLYLKAKKANLSQLLCVDLVCHGVPSPVIFKEYCSFYEKNRKAKIRGFRFRSKKYGWGDGIGACNYIQTVITDKEADDKSFISRLWQNVFFSDLATRQCCFRCPYTSVNKPADITLGDFWGISQCMKELDDHAGTSLVICRSDKGREYLKEADIIIKQVSNNNKAIKTQSRLKTPCQKPTNYDLFWQDYKISGFAFCASKYFNYNRINKTKYWIKMNFYAMGMFRIANRIFNDILI